MNPATKAGRTAGQPGSAPDLSTIVNKKIVRADSSLKNFSIVFDDQTALSLDAVDREDGAAIESRLLDATELKAASEAVCAVDWSWIYQSSVVAVEQDRSKVRLALVPAGPLSVSVSLWQGSAFLAFHPFKPSR